jgi:hypothetical protein
LILQCINAYTYCLRAKEHLTNKAGGKVWYESTHISQLMRRDANNNISEKDCDGIIKRVRIYLEHDMVSSA